MLKSNHTRHFSLRSLWFPNIHARKKRGHFHFDYEHWDKLWDTTSLQSASQVFVCSEKTETLLWEACQNPAHIHNSFQGSVLKVLTKNTIIRQLGNRDHWFLNMGSCNHMIPGCASHANTSLLEKQNLEESGMKMRISKGKSALACFAVLTSGDSPQDFQFELELSLQLCSFSIYVRN